MFIRIGNSQIVNKNLIWEFLKNKTTILIVRKPIKLAGMIVPEYITFGTEYSYNTESECSKAFENIILHNNLNNYINENLLINNKFIKVLKKYK